MFWGSFSRTITCEKRQWAHKLSRAFPLTHVVYEHWGEQQAFAPGGVPVLRNVNRNLRSGSKRLCRRGQSYWTARGSTRDVNCTCSAIWSHEPMPSAFSRKENSGQCAEHPDVKMCTTHTLICAHSAARAGHCKHGPVRRIPEKDSVRSIFYRLFSPSAKLLTGFSLTPERAGCVRPMLLEKESWINQRIRTDGSELLQDFCCPLAVTQLLITGQKHFQCRLTELWEG